MDKREIEIWWSSLPIVEKERIARKGLAKQLGKEEEEVKDDDVRYPACTRWWEALEWERREWIYGHCVAHHGDELKEWKEGNPYGD